MHRYLQPRSADHSPHDHPAKRQRVNHAHVSDAAPVVRYIWHTPESMTSADLSALQTSVGCKASAALSQCAS